MHKRIKDTLEQIRPFLQADGGDISLVEIKEDLTVVVKLLGACGSCPMSTQTLKAGVERTLKANIPEIKEVVELGKEHGHGGGCGH
ncbi:MAG: NifU family protein [Bacteroidetes bacterium]|nr:NifU family protein [Bacteroidota bacterium]MBT6685930.1 NifU family protein [Bacteroidota bacterium]MBT7143750.1 NifU family protein [Bacteroidota bacterium]MBT7492690.1 NifU family protein [Bacteroidota bacterium]